MPTELVDKAPADGGKPPEAVIRSQVLRGLGRAGARLRVVVRPLWENHYRVNVYAGAEGPEMTIAHSYFLVADDAGNVLEATPKIRPPKPAPAAG
jgi:hypothetical protein